VLKFEPFEFFSLVYYGVHVSIKFQLVLSILEIQIAGKLALTLMKDTECETVNSFK